MEPDLRADGLPHQDFGGNFRRNGLRPVAHGSQLLPKLLGTYEEELNPFLEDLIAAAPDLVVDVGSAEGYYAVGMALALPAARVIAYDINPDANSQLMSNAARNKVAHRIETPGPCTPAILEAVLSGAKSPAVISDCEGYEFDLLDPALVPSLKNCRMIVEIHPDESTRILESFLSKFRATHTIQKVSSRTRNLSDWPTALGHYRLSDAEREVALRERSFAQDWIVLEPMA